MSFTLEEAEQFAIQAGALRPQGMKENMAEGIAKSNNWAFRWEYTERAQSRLQAWTQAILNGTHPNDLRRLVG
jgi:hypothetical protein